MSQLTKEDAVAFLKDYITSEQDFIQQLKQKKCLLVEYLPQIEEKQMMNSLKNESKKNPFQVSAKILTDNAYEDIKFLGQGSFGVVLSVKQSSMRYAFKGIYNYWNDPDQIFEEFQNQLKLRSCEYVMQGLSINRYENYFFISLEHCLCSLDNFFELQILNTEDPNKRQLIILNEPTVIKMIYEIASGIAYGHSKNIPINIKPESIMINKNLKCLVKNIRFSSNFQSRYLSSKDSGNCMFMAPEIFKQATSNNKYQEQQSQKVNNNLFIQGDLYSLGLLFGQMIIGRKFSNLIYNAKVGGKQQLIEKIQECLIQNGYQFKTEIINIINNLLSDIPEKRYSAEQIRQQLKKMYDHFGFDKIIHKNLCDNKPMAETIKQYFQNDVEFIPSFNQEIIISISKNLQQQLCQNLTLPSLKEGKQLNKAINFDKIESSQSHIFNTNQNSSNLIQSQGDNNNFKNYFDKLVGKKNKINSSRAI